MSINELNAPVAARIVALMKEKGLKQNAVARRAGFSKQQFNDMLNGRRLIKVSELPILAKALEVSPNALFSDNAEQIVLEAS